MTLTFINGFQDFNMTPQTPPTALAKGLKVALLVQITIHTVVLLLTLDASSGMAEALKTILFIELIASLILGIMFVSWKYAIAEFLDKHASPEAPRSHSPGWAVGGYFIPFANLLIPFSVMKGLWHLAYHDADDWVDAGIVSRWWAAYIGGIILAALVLIPDVARHLPPELLVATRQGLAIAVDVFLIALIGRLTLAAGRLNPSANAEAVKSVVHAA